MLTTAATNATTKDRLLILPPGPAALIAIAVDWVMGERRLHGKIANFHEHENKLCSRPARGSIALLEASHLRATHFAPQQGDEREKPNANSHRQRSKPQCRCRARHPAVVGIARHARHD